MNRAYCLSMEILDAEFESDRFKLTVYYFSNRRVDFRELVRDLYSRYKARIWMQQVFPSSIHKYQQASVLSGPLDGYSAIIGGYIGLYEMYAQDCARGHLDVTYAARPDSLSASKLSGSGGASPSLTPYEDFSHSPLLQVIPPVAQVPYPLTRGGSYIRYSSDNYGSNASVVSANNGDFYVNSVYGPTSVDSSYSGAQYQSSSKDYVNWH